MGAHGPARAGTAERPSRTRRAVEVNGESATILNSLRRIVRHLRLSDREAEMACGVSAAQLFVLHQLANAPAPSLARLAELTLTDQSSVSTVVARLVARGLVTRTASRTDRRRAELRLTAAGRRVVVTAPMLPQAQLIAAVRAMPPGQSAEVARALERLAAAIGADVVAPRMLFEDEPGPPSRRRRKRQNRGPSPAS